MILLFSKELKIFGFVDGETNCDFTSDNTIEEHIAIIYAI